MGARRFCESWRLMIGPLCERLLFTRLGMSSAMASAFTACFSASSACEAAPLCFCCVLRLAKLNQHTTDIRASKIKPPKTPPISGPAKMVVEDRGSMKPEAAAPRREEVAAGEGETVVVGEGDGDKSDRVCEDDARTVEEGVSVSDAGSAGVKSALSEGLAPGDRVLVTELVGLDVGVGVSDDVGVTLREGVLL